MESYIPISFLNDFIFCPRSIYFHQLYGSYNSSLYQQKPQVSGKAAHEAIDNKTYSTRKSVLQGQEIYCEQYKLCGKIDTYDINSGRLTERKKEIKQVYDGYVFQTYAQCFALREMGYNVTAIVFYDITHNRTHPVPLPEEDELMFQKFEALVAALNTFNLDDDAFKPVEAKCCNCIYSNLCDYSLC